MPQMFARLRAPFLPVVLSVFDKRRPCHEEWRFSSISPAFDLIALHEVWTQIDFPDTSEDTQAPKITPLSCSDNHVRSWVANLRPWARDDFKGPIIATPTNPRFETGPSCLNIVKFIMTLTAIMFQLSSIEAALAISCNFKPFVKRIHSNGLLGLRRLRNASTGSCQDTYKYLTARHILNPKL